VLVFFAVLLSVLLGRIAFAVDLGMVARERIQIQQAADAAALAGAAALDQARQAGDRAAGDAAVATFAAYNQVGSDPVPADALQVELGRWDASSGTWSATALNQANSVRVTAEMLNRPMYFARLFRTQARAARASSTALGQASTREIYCLLDGTDAMQPFGRGSAVAAGFTHLSGILPTDQARDRLGVLWCSEISGTQDVAEAAAACQAAGIVVHTLAVGDDAPVALLGDIAAATGGQHFAPANSTDLAQEVTAAFAELANTPRLGVSLVE
jgi:Flp pilus assembly protein TadG